MSIKDYVPVMQRVTKFREDNKDKKILINTTWNINWEKEAVIFRAEILVDGEVKGVGHKMAPSLGEDSEFEKAETGAVGRALAFMGYEADDGASDDDDDSKKDSKESKKGLGRGLGSKKSTKKVEKEEEEENEEDEDDETDEEDSDDDESGEDDSETDDDEEDSEEDEDEEESDKKEDKKPVKAGGNKLADIMGKYGLDKKK